MAYSIKTEININAPPQVVSGILFDFDNFSKWNSFLVKIDCPKASREATKFNELVGTRISIFVSKNDDNLPDNYHPTVTVATPSELRWVGLLTHKWILAGEHFFEIVSTGPDSCIFRHGEKFSGGLPWCLNYTSFYEKLRPSFDRMNEELKTLAEGMAAGTVNDALKTIETRSRGSSYSSSNSSAGRKNSKSSSKGRKRSKSRPKSAQKSTVDKTDAEEDASM